MSLRLLAAAFALGAIIAPYIVLPLLGLLGFGAAGPIAGAAAAGIQASIGNVAAGSLFATLQSIAMGGAFPFIGHNIVGAIFAAGAFCASSLARWLF